MAASDLTNLSSVKGWLDPGGATLGGSSDAQLNALITSMSRAIYSKLQRPNILPMAYSETLNGNGASSLMLKSWPVVSFASLYVDGTLISPAPALPQQPFASYGMGWVLEAVDPAPPGRPQSLFMRGGGFRRGLQNIAVSYTAGYQVSETQTVPSGALTTQQPYGDWASDQGVVYASTGVALTVTTGTPAQGQYKVTSEGIYNFNSTDNGAAVIISYGFIPADLAQATIEWIALRFVSQKNIGVKSQGLAGQETITYDVSAVPQFVMTAIQPFKRIVMT